MRDVFDPELWMSKTLSNWEKLSQDILEYNRLYVMEYVYFQNSIGNMLLGDTPDYIIEDFCFSIEKIILQHKPVLIYFSARDVSHFLSETYNNRDNQWRTHINSLIGQTPYGINRQLSGFEGFKEFYKEYIRITKRLYESLKVKISSRNWNKIEDSTHNFLEL